MSKKRGENIGGRGQGEVDLGMTENNIAEDIPGLSRSRVRRLKKKEGRG